MEQTVHTSTDLNGKLTATQLRQVFHWILYRSERRLSEWWRHRLSRWCQLCGWCVCVCVLCERVCVCEAEQAVHALSLILYLIHAYECTAPGDETCPKLCRTSPELRTCFTPVQAWRGAVTSPEHTPGGIQQQTQQTQTTKIWICMLNTLVYSFPFSFPLGFFFFYSPFDQDISASDKKGNPLLFFFFTEAASPPLEVKLGSATRQPHRVWRWRGVDLESCVRIGLRDVRVVSRQRWCQPGFDCEGRDRRWGNRRSPKYCFLFLFLSLL